MPSSLATHSADVVTFAAQSLIASAWQGAVLVACISVSLRLLRGVSAAVRCFVWVATLLLLLTLPLLDMRASRFSGAPGAATLEVSMQWVWLLAAVWLLCSSFRLEQLVRSAWHVHRVCSQAMQLTPSQSSALDLDDLKCVSSRPTKICTSVDVGVPCVAGFISPRVLLPSEILTSLSPDDLRQIIQHEFEHVRRRDDWVNLLQKVGLVLFPLSPGLWWVERRLCAERELACDDRVLRQTRAPKAYARCLANLADQSSRRHGFSLMLGAWHRRGALAERIHRILSAPRGCWSPIASAVSVVALLGAVTVAALALGRTTPLIDFRSPASAQTSAAATLLLPSRSNMSVRTPTRQLPDAAVGGRVSKKSGTHLANDNIAQRELALPKVVDTSTVIRPTAVKHTTTGTLIDRQRLRKIATQPVFLQDESHHTYAAIPTFEGWVIVQL